MSTTIRNDLHEWDTVDKYEMRRRARTYNYTLRVWDGGKVRFRMHFYQPAMLGESGGGHWYELEDRSNVASGTTLSGSFTVPPTALSSSVSTEWTLIRAKFSRGLGTSGVNYELYFEPA